MSTLTALEVSGDAFLLETDRKTILVDGGRTAWKLAEALVKHRPALSHIDIIVCTHADEDHAEGLVDFPKRWESARGDKSVSVGEFWLPGRWSDLVAAGMRDAKDLINAIVHDIDALNLANPALQDADGETLTGAILGEDVALESGHVVAPGNEGGESRDGNSANAVKPSIERAKRDLPAVFEHLEGLSSGGASMTDRTMVETPASPAVDPVIAPRLRRGRLVVRPDHEGDSWDRDPESSREPDWLSDLEDRARAILRDGDGWDHQFELGRRRIDYRATEPGKKAGNRPSPQIAVGKEAAQYWRALIDTAERIGKVAATAIAAGARIRWFDQQEFEQTGMRRGGIPGVLQPMNSCEQRGPTVASRPDGAILYMLTISKTNRESLVFYAPPALTQGAGALFCADTALTWGYGDVWPLPAFASMKTTDTVATAPHHGSENNKIAYAHGANFYRTAFWLRSENGGRVGATFKSLSSRACTMCPGHYPLRTVEVPLSWPDWSTLSFLCDCR